MSSGAGKSLRNDCTSAAAIASGASFSNSCRASSWSSSSSSTGAGKARQAADRDPWRESLRPLEAQSIPRSMRAPRSMPSTRLRRWIGDDQHRRSLAPGAAGAARAMLQRLRVARQLDVNHERDRWQIDAARGDIGGDADPRALVAQRLKRLIALVLAMLARQRDRIEAPFGQAGVEPAHGLARGAEQDRVSASWKRSRLTTACSMSVGDTATA